MAGLRRPGSALLGSTQSCPQEPGHPGASTLRSAGGGPWLPSALETEPGRTGCTQAPPEKMGAGSEAGSLATEHSRSPLTSAELPPVTAAAALRGVPQTWLCLAASGDASESPQVPGGPRRPATLVISKRLMSPTQGLLSWLTVTKLPASEGGSAPPRHCEGADGEYKRGRDERFLQETDPAPHTQQGPEFRSQLLQPKRRRDLCCRSQPATKNSRAASPLQISPQLPPKEDSHHGEHQAQPRMVPRGPSAVDGARRHQGCRPFRRAC